MAQPNPTLKMDPHLRQYLSNHPDGTANLMMLARVTGSHPPANWSQLEWKSCVLGQQPNGHTIWYVTVPQSQVLSLAQSPEVAVLHLGASMQLL